VSGPPGERLVEGMLQLLGIVLHAGILPHVAALLAAAAAVLRRAGTADAPRVRFEVILGLGWLAYWLYVGGDVFAERMLLILFPVGILLLLDPALFPLPGRSAYVVAGLTALFQLLPLAADTRFGYALDRYDRWVTLGRHLAQASHAGRLLAVDAAGKIPFYSGLPVVDMLGLNDVHIAHLPAGYFEAGHNKYDPDYVLARRPDLIADWIDPRLDLRFGLTREKYETAGFRLAALVYTRKHLGDAPALVEIGARARPGDVDVLIRRGYRYALLVRR